jgi:hypothetical protein
MEVKTMSKKWKHNYKIYQRFIIPAFAYAVVLTIPAELMLLSLDLGKAMVSLLILEVFTFFILPYIPWVRQTVDRRIQEEERAEAIVTRANLLVRMSETHRRELHALETIGTSLMKRSGTDSLPDDCIGVERLIKLYVKFAIAHRESCDALHMICNRPEDEIAGLEMNMSKHQSQIDKWVKRRLILLQKRRTARAAAIVEQTTIIHKLGLISDTVRWMQEECASTDATKLYDELDFALSNNDRDIQTLKEFTALHEPLVRIGVVEEEFLEYDEAVNSRAVKTV